MSFPDYKGIEALANSVIEAKASREDIWQLAGVALGLIDRSKELEELVIDAYKNQIDHVGSRGAAWNERAHALIESLKELDN